MIKKLVKFSNYLQSKGLSKEADYLHNMIEQDLMMEGDMDMTEGYMMKNMDEDSEEFDALDDDEEVVEFSEQGVDVDSEELLETDDLTEMEDEGEEFSFEGQSTSNFHCCPEAKDALSMICDSAGSEEEIDLCMEIMEEVDAFLGDKLSLMDGGGSKDDLCEFMNKGLSAMYAIGQASGIMDEDISEGFQFIADAIDDVCSELLEE